MFHKENRAMKALVYTTPGKVEVHNISVPHANSDEVIVRVQVAGICGSDGTTYSFSNDGYSVRSSFGSRCNISSTSTEIFFNC